MAYTRKTLYLSSLVALFSLQSVMAATKISYFPDTNSSMLEVTSDIYIEVYEDQKMTNKIGNITLNKNDQTVITSNPKTCTYDKNTPSSDCELTISFPDQGNIKLDLTFRYNKTRIQGYWEWAKLTVEGTVSGKTVSPTSNGKINVHPKGQGFTQNQIYDISCERDYTTCAPLTLSWTCDDQKMSSEDNSDNPIRITFPGLQLQPFFNNQNSTAAKFGAVWSCDPLLSIPIWTGLLIGLGLLLGFLWAIGMIASVNTPDKFDDPKGKQISVPQQD